MASSHRRNTGLFSMMAGSMSTSVPISEEDGQDPSARSIADVDSDAATLGCGSGSASEMDQPVTVGGTSAPADVLVCVGLAGLESIVLKAAEWGMAATWGSKFRAVWIGPTVEAVADGLDWEAGVWNRSRFWSDQDMEDALGWCRGAGAIASTVAIGVVAWARSLRSPKPTIKPRPRPTLIFPCPCPRTMAAPQRAGRRQLGCLYSPLETPQVTPNSTDSLLIRIGPLVSWQPRNHFHQIRTAQGLLKI